MEINHPPQNKNTNCSCPRCYSEPKRCCDCKGCEAGERCICGKRYCVDSHQAKPEEKKEIEACPKCPRYPGVIIPKGYCPSHPSPVQEKECVCGFHVGCSKADPCIDCPIHAPKEKECEHSKRVPDPDCENCIKRMSTPPAKEEKECECINYKDGTLKLCGNHKIIRSTYAPIPTLTERKGEWEKNLNEWFDQLVDFIRCEIDNEVAAKKKEWEAQKEQAVKAEMREMVEYLTHYLRSKFSQDCSRNETAEEKSTEMLAKNDVLSLLSDKKPLS